MDGRKMVKEPAVLQASEFIRLVPVLESHGYQVYGPCHSTRGVYYQRIGEFPHRGLLGSNSAFFPISSAKETWRAAIELLNCRLDGGRVALLGLRPCDLPLLARLKLEKEKVFRIVINCAAIQPSCDCICDGIGPSAVGDYDLAVTEVCEGNIHYFVTRVGTPAGQKILDLVGFRKASGMEQLEAKARDYLTTRALNGLRPETGESQADLR